MRDRYWDSDYLSGFVKGLKIKQDYEYERGKRDGKREIYEQFKQKHQLNRGMWDE